MPPIDLAATLFPAGSGMLEATYVVVPLIGFLLVGFAFIVVPSFIDREQKRVQAAFAAAPMLSLSLFLTYLLLALFDCWSGSCGGGPEAAGAILFYFVIGMAIGAVPVLLVTALIAYPVYRFLDHFSVVSASAITASSFFIGLIMGYIIFQPPDYGMNHLGLTAVLPAGICAAIGGLFFSWLTLWRKTAANGAPDAPE